NFIYIADKGTFAYSRRTPDLQWSDTYKAALRASDWKKHGGRATPTSSPILDLDDEIQRLLRRARDYARDAEKLLFHQGLLPRLEKLSVDYRISEGLEYESEAKRRTLFDRSVEQQTMRATKFSK